MVDGINPKLLDWIGADWGTSNLRVWAFDAGGHVLAKVSSPQGMGRLSPGDFEPHLLSLVDTWIPKSNNSKIPVLVCGMAGARQGWHEAGYRDVPCAPATSEGLAPVITANRQVTVSIIPGLAQRDPPDVMRGEETQIAGLVSTGIRDAIVCLPGTHSKWVTLENGAITGFQTFMTGELFSILGEYSILRHSMQAGSDSTHCAAYIAAVRELFEAPENLTSALFSIRAAGLAGEGSIADAGSERLSGMLIGAELAATRYRWRGKDVHLAGEEALCARYGRALGEVGAKFSIHDGEALTLAGLKLVRAELSRLGP